ncbi:MAG: hypothetical protein JNM36_09910 [Chitinophagales bacterium]|nr:hypothetical protein [Chitinophagales bacterium]HNI44582.1 hypothetical protein [Chitinophagales bacterium]HNL06104.1 hypothetical protein [Chitinophagales bacterium]
MSHSSTYAPSNYALLLFANNRSYDGRECIFYVVRRKEEWLICNIQTLFSYKKSDNLYPTVIIFPFLTTENQLLAKIQDNPMPNSEYELQKILFEYYLNRIDNNEFEQKVQQWRDRFNTPSAIPIPLIKPTK